MALNINASARPLLEMAYEASPAMLRSLVDQSNNMVSDSWALVMQLTSQVMVDSHYFRLCVLPTGLSILLFWCLNVPLLFFNFFPTWNPMESWKIQKGRYETRDRVAWMVLTVLVNQTLAMIISCCSQNYQGLLDAGVKSGMSAIPSVGDLLWQVSSSEERRGTLLILAPRPRFLPVACFMTRSSSPATA